MTVVTKSSNRTRARTESDCERGGSFECFYTTIQQLVGEAPRCWGCVRRGNDDEWGFSKSYSFTGGTWWRIKIKRWLFNVRMLIKGICLHSMKIFPFLLLKWTPIVVSSQDHFLNDVSPDEWRWWWWWWHTKDNHFLLDKLAVLQSSHEPGSSCGELTY